MSPTWYNFGNWELDDIFSVHYRSPFFKDNTKKLPLVPGTISLYLAIIGLALV